MLNKRREERLKRARDKEGQYPKADNYSKANKVETGRNNDQLKRAEPLK